MNNNVTDLKGVGEKKAKALSKLNIKEIDDLLYCFPRGYEDRRVISPIKEIKSEGNYLIKGKVLNITKGNRYAKGKTVLKVRIGDYSGEIVAVFFNANYISNSINIGEEHLFFGKFKNGQLIFPEFINVERGIVPIYNLTKGITQGEFRKYVKCAIEKYFEPENNAMQESLPNLVFEKNNLCSLEYAIRNLHFPENKEKLGEALYRLQFEELLAFQIGINLIKNQEYKNNKGKIAKADEGDYLKKIPFALTRPQKKVIKEICEDLEKNEPMNRLLQGDVGSGKTVVAEVAIYKVVKSNLQAALMAPTEVLARQHFNSITKSFEKENINVALLTSSIKKKEKDKILENLKNGKIDLIIGTHALIQNNVKFKELGIAITDEQHRFGVTQRALMAEKGEGEYPNILVMTATPIPRTLGIILYGDLDISIIDYLPENRKPIITTKVSENNRKKGYELLENEVKKGRQGYIVAPLIAESEVIEARSAEAIYKEVKELFPDMKIALLHGNIKEEEKNEIMEQFQAGNINILVATVVVEVGINVPNASVMIIESSDRFGLSQLHQLRGRVGRGKEQSYCVLMYDKITSTSQKRLDIMVESNDGFYISEKDMELRGVGDIFGTMQHGFEGNKIFEIAKNIKLLMKTQKAASEILENDQKLIKEQNRGVRKRVENLFGNNISFLGKI